VKPPVYLFIHKEKVKATKLFQNSAPSLPFLVKTETVRNSAADLSGLSLFLIRALLS
jgi:hypothetical protein